LNYEGILLLIVFTLQISSQLQLTSSSIQAVNYSVTLNCEFVLESENLTYTEIEWNIVPSDKQQGGEIIIWYTGGVIYNKFYEPLKNRVHFASCHVKLFIYCLLVLCIQVYPKQGEKVTGVLKNFNLFVMERLSRPVCYIDGEAVEGNNLRMRCSSSQGTPALDYSWSKASGNQMLPQSAFVDTTADDLCMVISLVGMEECESLSWPRHPTSTTLRTSKLFILLLRKKYVSFSTFHFLGDQDIQLPRPLQRAAFTPRLPHSSAAAD
uniref:Ig-like domain-containing protein n=1 Tax=Oreochromis niloticus TaxID=8128 RepID=A0A669B5C2_ORENI